MTEMISESAFHLVLSVAVGGVAALWLLHDVVLLARLRGDRRDPLIADQRFGYAMGIVIGAIGIAGTLLFLRSNGVL